MFISISYCGFRKKQPTHSVEYAKQPQSLVSSTLPFSYFDAILNRNKQ